jgi:hypothetical protein
MLSSRSSWSSSGGSSSTSSSSSGSSSSGSRQLHAVAKHLATEGGQAPAAAEAAAAGPAYAGFPAEHLDPRITAHQKKMGEALAEVALGFGRIVVSETEAPC